VPWILQQEVHIYYTTKKGKSQKTGKSEPEIQKQSKKYFFVAIFVKM